MSRQFYRLLLVVVSTAVAAAGVLSLTLGGSQPAAASDPPYVIEASETGFNPSLCIISRDDVVMWKNVGATVRRVVVPDVGVESPPLFDTGDIAPGETSLKWVITHGGAMKYQDFYNPTLKGAIQTPQYSNSGPESCSPQAPTPTPTATVPATATVQPTQAPRPMRCITSVGCAVAPAVSRDDQ